MKKVIAFGIIFLISLCVYSQDLAWPLASGGKTSSDFGDRQDPMGGTGAGWHDGLDIACVVGTSIIAVGDGEVVSVYIPPTKRHPKWGDAIFGGMIMLKTKYQGVDVWVRYGHLSEIWIKEGTIVHVGDVLGKTGNSGYSTGPHLHYEILLNPSAIYTKTREIINSLK